MSAQRASTPVRLARAAAAVVLTALAAVVIVRLAGRRTIPFPPSVPPPPEGRVVDVKERVRHEEYEGGRLVADIRGDTFFRGPDGRNHLTGSIEITNLGPAGEVTSRLTAGEVAYEPGSLRFTVSGRVRVEAGDVVLEGESFEYDKTAGLFATAAGGRFASKTMSGSAAGISYAEGADEIRLGGGFRFEVAARDEADRALALSGDSLVFGRRDRRGRAEGRPALDGAGFKAAAAATSFVASPDGSSLESAVFEGAAVAVFENEGAAGEGSGEVRAERIAVTFSRDPYGLAILASGDSRLILRPAPDSLVTVGSPKVLLNVFSGVHIPTWEASGGIRAEITEAGGLRRTIEGERVHSDGGTLHAYGRSGEAAVADSVEARIEAPRILFAPASQELLASGGVAGVLKGGEGRRRIGFFSPLEDVSFSSERSEYMPEGSIYLLTGYVFVRQGPNTLRASEIEFGGTAGRMSCAGGVAITLTEAAQGGQARTVEMGGQAMAYRPDLRTLRLTTKAFVKLPEARLEAGSVSAVIGREEGGVESLTAAGGVVVTKGDYTGRAEAAAYDAAAGRITLTGHPVLTDREGGSARGDRLTFDLADDKILVENEGSGRSTTVIKS
jgi:lipopolysaccharide export system protein LptA